MGAAKRTWRDGEGEDEVEEDDATIVSSYSSFISSYSLSTTTVAGFGSMASLRLGGAGSTVYELAGDARLVIVLGGARGLPRTRMTMMMMKNNPSPQPMTNITIRPTLASLSPSRAS